jgi:hypothetical protein
MDWAHGFVDLWPSGDPQVLGGLSGKGVARARGVRARQLCDGPELAAAIPK